MTYVPGHGDVADRADVEEFRGYLVDLKALVNQARKAGVKGDALVASVAPTLKANHPGWTISDRAAAAEIRYMDEELAGTKKRPVPAAD